MMNNPFTSWSGIILLIASILNIVGHALAGSLDQNQVALSVGGIGAGVGLLKARDGGL